MFIQIFWTPHSMNKLTLNEPAMNELKESAKKEPEMGEANAMPWVSVELIDDLRLGERTDLHIFLVLP